MRNPEPLRHDTYHQLGCGAGLGSSDDLCRLVLELGHCKEAPSGMLSITPTDTVVAVDRDGRVQAATLTQIR
jgi:hypothetical protein